MKLPVPTGHSIKAAIVNEVNSFIVKGTFTTYS